MADYRIGIDMGGTFTDATLFLEETARGRAPISAYGVTLIVTGALKDRGRAKVVGTHTYGKGVFQEIQSLPNGGALDITVGEYFTPKGRNLGGGGVTQGAGISPDVKVAERVVVPP